MGCEPISAERSLDETMRLCGQIVENAGVAEAEAHVTVTIHALPSGGEYSTRALMPFRSVPL